MSVNGGTSLATITPTNDTASAVAENMNDGTNTASVCSTQSTNQRDDHRVRAIRAGYRVFCSGIRTHPVFKLNSLGPYNELLVRMNRIHSIAKIVFHDRVLPVQIDKLHVSLRHMAAQALLRRYRILYAR
jgi:hypothetical protein